MYEPDEGYVGSDSIVFYVDDGELNSNQATISITVQEAICEEETIFTEEFFPDPLFRAFVEHYMRIFFTDPDPNPFEFTASDAAQVTGEWTDPDQFNDDIHDMTGLEFFTGLTAIQTNEVYILYPNEE